ncbi:hypothetical protein RSOLAG1IB_06684 [Rhizoctonia solani AG-1 IB]|uniref:Uncharacterized protein n=1 Tax=Thanatephorus cucumeris (strain AG1-IB / isolate 7/3/14) TaxID=1108050 RepID=A0A0B7FCD1_THACB|nr:hypothetical protein RSOLAG1IB_06684 [Rhizoctonia solani AG-1 IB]
MHFHSAGTIGATCEQGKPLMRQENRAKLQRTPSNNTRRVTVTKEKPSEMTRSSGVLMLLGSLGWIAKQPEANLPGSSSTQPQTDA